MEKKERYYHLNQFLKNKFGQRTLKICIDGGFTCPNRDGTISQHGCLFCSEKGSGEHICSSENITKQVENYFSSYKSQRANRFIAYFQNFTNTYDSVPNLKSKYDAALIDNRIVGLAIATRPDCINAEVLELLKSYQNNYYVWVELGLQTSNDATAKRINRGYLCSQFTKAVKLLNQFEIDIVVHIMVGLPGEDFNDIIHTVDFLNQHIIQGLKIHSTYVVKHTGLANLYENGDYSPISLETYLNNLTYILTHISPNIVIHRISGDAPKDLLLAPSWNLHKKWILNGLEKRMKEKNLYQGMNWNKCENF